MVNYLPSQASTQITVTTLNVGTTLSINAPANIIQGQPFDIAGVLQRSDTNMPLNGETIELSIDGSIVASTVTATMGTPAGPQEGMYSFTQTIEETGTHSLVVDFAGSTRPGLTFLPSLARTGVILEGITPYLPYLIPVAILAWLLLSKK